MNQETGASRPEIVQTLHRDHWQNRLIVQLSNFSALNEVAIVQGPTDTVSS
jgi:hypothetical protein